MVILRPIGTIGNRLKYLRKIRGLTRKEAAVKLDMKEERKLNIKDAIRIIKGLDTSNSEENIEAKKMAVKALEKQRQKKIETWNGQASCPCCKKLFGEMKTIRNLTTWEMPYCKFCGQALDWSDEQ